MYLRYVNEYAEVLFRWELYHKRLELLKVVHPHVIAEADQHEIGEFSSIILCISDLSVYAGVSRLCGTCHAVLPVDAGTCSSCSHSSGMPNCSICRLPVKGSWLSYGVLWIVSTYDQLDRPIAELHSLFACYPYVL